ncbi:MAG: VOC family protein [Gemmatimonadota bacterium]
MELGAFSVSLAVENLERSRAFYEKLGFEVTGGDPDHGYLILVNGTTTIGLFQGMFEADGFTDVREIAERLEAAGIELTARELPEGGGAAHVALTDPDGNPILIDQHR